MIDPDGGLLHLQQVVQHEAGWRIGYAVTRPDPGGSRSAKNDQHDACRAWAPIVQLAGQAALENDAAERDEGDAAFQDEGGAAGRRPAQAGRRSRWLMPPGTFYVFPERGRRMCQAAGDQIARSWRCIYWKGRMTSAGVACLGGECFGGSGAGLPALQLRRNRDDRPCGKRLAFLAEAV